MVHSGAVKRVIWRRRSSQRCRSHKLQMVGCQKGCIITYFILCSSSGSSFHWKIRTSNNIKCILYESVGCCI